MLKRILSICAALVLAIGCFFFNGLKTLPTVSYAATKNGLDVSSVESDLGDDFDWSKYPKNKLGDIDVVQFVEYCYTNDLSMNGNYSLYLFIYNPKAVAFAPIGNVVNMAVEYNEKGEPSAYSNLSLSLCGYTSGSREYLIYKFRVNISARTYTFARNCQEENGYRRYDISGIQLRAVGVTDSEDSEIARSYRCTGFAKGYDESSESLSTYKCTWDDNAALELDLHSTFYRPEGTNGKNSYTQDTLHTVYFSVPNSIVNKFDILNRVRFSYVKALTDFIFVTGNHAVYSDFLKYIGRPSTDAVLLPDKLDYTFVAHDINDRWIYAYNNVYVGNDCHRIAQLDYIFWAGEGVDSADNFNLDSDLLLEWMEDYDDIYGADGNYLLVDGSPYRNYAAELFESSFRRIKTTEIDIYSDETRILNNVEINRSSWWDLLWMSDDYEEVSSDPFEGIEAIKAVDSLDLSLTPEEICDSLYIDYSDYAEFLEFYTLETLKDRTVFLLRFDVSPYVSIEVIQGKVDNNNHYIGMKDTDTNGYLAYQYVYFDCDVIFLEYEKDGAYTVIPVVASPIDVIADVTPPVYTTSDKEFDWWGLIMSLLMLVVLVFIILNFAPRLLIEILKGVWKIICLPFKKIGQALRRRR